MSAKTPRSSVRVLRNAAALLVAAALTIVSLVSAPLGASAADKYALSSKLRYTAVSLSWKAQPGASVYQVQYGTSSTFKSAKTIEASGTTKIINRLSTGHTYYFRVRVKGTSSWSSKVSRVPNHPKLYDTGYKVEKATKISTDNVSGSAIDFTWTTPSAQYACFRFSVAPTPSGGQPAIQCTTVFTLKGLKKGTIYTVKLYTSLPPATVDGVAWPDIDITGASASVSKTTSNYTLAAPDGLRLTSQEAYQATVEWTAPTNPAPAATDRYRIQLAANTAMTKSASWWPTTTDATSITLTGLSSNKVHYVRVVMVDAAGKQRSDKSNYLLVKTLIPRGTITGTISGAPDGDVVAVAYDSSGELAAQDDLDSDGKYSLSVRPGTYKVRATYLGGGDYYSSWVSPKSPALVSADATPLVVKHAKATAAGTTPLGHGAKISGTVVDNTGAKVSGATVSLLTGASGGHEVIGSVLSNGTFSINGVPNGSFRLRVKFIGSGTYPTAATYGVTVSGSDITKKVVLTRR